MKTNLISKIILASMLVAPFSLNAMKPDENNNNIANQNTTNTTSTTSGSTSTIEGSFKKTQDFLQNAGISKKAALGLAGAGIIALSAIFMPKTCNNLLKIAVSGLGVASGLLYCNHMLSKPANQEAATMLGSIQMWCVEQFGKIKNWFSKKEEKEEKKGEIK